MALDSRIQVGVVVRMKKPHPCGKKNYLFKVVYIGNRIELECMACHHRTFIDIPVFEQKLKEIIE